MTQHEALTPQSLLFQIHPVTSKYRVPSTLVATILQVESNWNPKAQGDWINGSPTSFGLFQLHLGGQAEQAIRDGYKTDDLYDPLINATYAMPAISSAWESLDGWNGFRPWDITWWEEFGSRSGHPGGVPGVDPANVVEARSLKWVYQEGLAMTRYSNTGEVGEFNEADQMQPGKSQFECGWFTTFIFLSMAPVGQTPRLSVQEIIDRAEADYGRFYGDNSIQNLQGMSDDEHHALILQIGRHYQESSTDVETIRAWTRLGYPVMVSVTEPSVYDLDLGGNPYPWNASGNHYILITGPGSGDTLVVRDPANCENLYDPTSLRKGPRHYSASRLQINTATALVPDWLPRPPLGYDPLKDGKFMGVPQGWQDNGSVLSVNGFTIDKGERDLILNHQPQWEGWNVPLEKGVDGVLVEESNPSIGYGYRRLYAGAQIEYTQKRGFFLGWLGQELKAVRADRDAKNAQLTSAQSQIKELQAKLDAAQKGGVPVALQKAVDLILSTLAPFKSKE